MIYLTTYKNNIYDIIISLMEDIYLVIGLFTIVVILMITDFMYDDQNADKEDFNVTVNNNNYRRRGYYGGYGGWWGWNYSPFPYGYTYPLTDGYYYPYRSWYSYFNPYWLWY